MRKVLRNKWLAKTCVGSLVIGLSYHFDLYALYMLGPLFTYSFATLMALLAGTGLLAAKSKL